MRLLLVLLLFFSDLYWEFYFFLSDFSINSKNKKTINCANNYFWNKSVRFLVSFGESSVASRKRMVTNYRSLPLRCDITEKIQNGRLWSVITVASHSVWNLWKIAKWEAMILNYRSLPHFIIFIINIYQFIFWTW